VPGPRLVVGTSGWVYRDWKDVLYEGVPQKRWLPRYAEEFPTVEVNGTFYRLPERSTFERWREQTPDGFVVTVKASRYLTHIKRLQDPEEPVGRLMERAEGLGDRLGPVLVQLPPDLRIELERLDRTLGAFPPEVRVVVEPRHQSWWTDETRALLEEHGAALCLADRKSRHVAPRWRTTDWGYLRLHEGRAHPWPHYGKQALASWAARLADCWGPGDEVLVYFNNDPGGWAVRDARTLLRLAARAGLPVAKPTHT
jgi:uncharacterized protein YecE (DUF72 family)